jgi:predicted MFS family arabinose efflux permease
MMGARTASAQLGYVLGAAGGGLVIELFGFGALGFFLFAGMSVSALLVLRVADPHAPQARAPRYPEPVPD